MGSAPRTKTWWGVADQYGALSQLFSMRGLAECALGERGDREACRLIKATVILQEVVKEPEPTKGRLFGRKAKAK